MMKRFTLVASIFIFLGLLISNSAYSQLSGNYTINPNGSGSTNYTSFANAVSALGTSGVSGAVTFTVSPGTYTERVSMSAISGASATNTITFDGVDKSMVSVEYSGNYNPRAVVALSGTDYVTFKNMTIKNTGTSYGWAVYLTNHADYNYFLNCDLIVATTTSSYFTVVAFSSSESYNGGGYNGYYNKFENCLVKGGYYGAYIYGAGSTSRISGNEFINCEFTNQYYYAVRNYYAENTTVQYCTIHNMGSTYAYGIYSYYSVGNYYDANTIQPGEYGIYSYRENYYSQSSNSYFTNNLISNFGNGNYQYGIRAYYYNYHVNILHNSIRCDASYSYYYYSSLFLYYAYYCVVKNNIISRPNGGYLFTVYYGSSTTSDYNDYYYPNGGSFYISGSTYSNLSSFSSNSSYFSGPHDQNSWDNSNPYFINYSNLHVTPPLNQQMEAPVLTGATNIDHDVDGESRPTSGSSMIGGDQVPPYDLDVVAMTPVVAKMGSNTVTMKLMNKGLNPVTSQTLTLQYSTDGGQNWTSENYVMSGNLAPGGFLNYSFTTAWNITVDQAYDLCVRVNPQITNDPDTEDKMCQTVKVGLSGIYTIDGSGSGDYLSFTAAATDLASRGVAGAVTFNVAPGTYNERVVVNSAIGVSATFPVIFDGADKSLVKLSYSGVQSAPSTVVLNGCDYITFTNMTVENTGSTYAKCFFFTNAADYNTISNCKISVINTYTGSYSQVIEAGSNETSTQSYGNNANYNTIDNNEIYGGYYGIHFVGSGSTSLIFGNTFSNNTIQNMYYYGIYSYYNGDANIRNNKISNNRSTYGYGIYSYFCRSSKIDGNIINPGRYGIYCFYENYYWSTGSYHSYIANNIVTDFKDATYQTGVNMYYDYYVNFYNNSIKVTGSYSSYSYAALYSYRSQYCDYKNNILESTNNTYVASFYYPYNSTSDYNDYIYNGTNKFFYPYYTQYNFTNFKNYNNSGYFGTHDQNSYDQVDPEFASSTDLHLRSGSLGLLGNYVTYPDKDVDADMRCQLQTYLGADEPAHVLQNIGFISQDTMCFFTPVTFYNTGLQNEPHEANWFVNDVYQTNTFDFQYSFLNSGYDTVALAMKTCFKTDTVEKYIYIDTPVVAPVSEFMANKNVVEVNEVIDLIDLTDHCPTGWAWEISPYMALNPNTGMTQKSFSYVNNTDSFNQNPQMVFNFPGIYTVKLSTINGMGNSPKESKTGYINVKFSDNICGQYEESSRQYGNLYDDGGPGANHGTYRNCNYLIRPCNDDVKITFHEFNLGSGAYLRLYDGADNKGIPLWSKAKYGDLGISGTMSNPNFDTIVYATQSGMVYVEFQSGGSTATGFKLEWTGIGTGTYYPPVASFVSEDTACIVYPLMLENTTVADTTLTKFSWDYDGNGSIDDNTVNGIFNAVFPGISAIYKTKLVAMNCGGTDTFERNTVMINPQMNPQNADFFGDVTKPAVNSDAVTFYPVSTRLSCVNSWTWTITPSTFYLIGGTNLSNENPRVVFTDTVAYDVTLVMGNTNSPKFNATIYKPEYIKPKVYCQPLVLNQHLDVGISRVMLNEIDNSSQTGIQGYTNYANDYSTVLVLNQPYDITVERNTNFNSMDRFVWIDYNNDGDFEDLGELVASQINSNSMSWTGTFTVPVTADLGGSVMRVAGIYAGNTATPCGPVNFGEYEDYRIFISNDNVPPVLTLIGADTMYSEIGYAFTDPGATAVDNLQGNIDTAIVVTNNVNLTTVGGYYIYYDVCDNLGNCAETVKRVVIITEDNTAPVLTLFSDTLYVNVNQTFNDSGSYSAIDLGDGDLSASVTRTGYVNTSLLGTYYLTYKVVDSKGLSDTKNRTIIVIDGAAPDIQLTGDNPMYVEIMTPYTEPGVTYSDNFWPTKKITYRSSGLVDTTRIGTYTISYSVTDASGNGPNTITRTVIVWDSTAPSIVLKGFDEVVIEVNTPFVDPGVQVNDNSHTGFTTYYSGTYYKYFTGKTSPDSIGLFSIFYYVEDEAGNISDMIARVVNVVDIRCPELTLTGDQYVSIERWNNNNPYIDPGYSVTDNYYTGNEIMVDTFNDVNIHQVGLYKVVYHAVDPSNNNCSSIVRLVKVVQTDLGVGEDGQGTVEVYPNPNNGKFVVNVNLPVSSVYISVIDMMGQEVKVINNGLLAKSTFEIDMSDFAAGVYMVKIESDKNTILKRIVISK